MNKKIYKKDCKYGFNCEDTLFRKIREKYGEDVKKTTRYATFDYENEKTQLELKNRRCKYTTYPSMMIGINKLKKAEDTKDIKKSIFLFNFIDGLYYWEYDKDQYYTAYGGRKDRGIDERRNTAFIPIKHLQPF